MSKYVPLEISKEDLARLEEEHEDISVYRGTERAPWLVVVRRPTFQESQAYKTMGADPIKKPLANVKLITAISVFPKNGTEDWKKQFDRWPFFPDGIADSDDFKDFIGIALSSAGK